jgi:hypothetical protein
MMSIAHRQEICCWACAPCTQAREDGTLDQEVVSLQARRALLKGLDLIPPEYTYQEAAAVMVGSKVLCATAARRLRAVSVACEAPGRKQGSSSGLSTANGELREMAARQEALMRQKQRTPPASGTHARSKPQLACLTPSLLHHPVGKLDQPQSISTPIPPPVTGC